MSRLTSMWKTEKDRHFLWLPVLFAIGVAGYYALPGEPSQAALWRLASAGGVLTSAGFTGRRRLFPWGIAVLLVALGALAAGLHTMRHTQPVVAAAVKPRPLSGLVEAIERTEHGVRFTLSEVTIADMPHEVTPFRVRLSVRPKAGSDLPWPRIGQRISLMAGLMPPMGPALPHGFDFSRYFFFRDIGAVGYGLPPWKLLPETADSTMQRFLDWRFRLTDRIIDTLGPRNGPVVAGLITGEARAITETDFTALKASNLYHIIAISGGHMVVIAGVIFIGLRFLLLALPGGLAQRARGKSLAAFVTLVLVTLYLAVTGMPISAVRAYVMIALVLFAVIAGRRVDAMRSLALTFWLMLVIDPSDLLEPGFQLSFAATLAIVALVEAAWFRSPLPAGEGIAAFMFRVFWMALLITVAAQAATLPLALAMFNNLPTYGLIANLLATPLVTFYLMPVVALFFLLLPFGLEHAALILMDYGVSALLWIAEWTSSLPHALVFVPSLPGWGVALFVLGLTWLCLWQRRWRYLGIPLMAVGMISFVTVRLPDVLVGPEAKQVALRTPDGFMQAKGKRNTMLAELWANGVGQAALLPRHDAYWRCDALGCVATVNGKRIAFPAHAAAVMQDCTQADIVVLTTKGGCAGKKTVVTRPQVQAIWLNDMRVESSADWQGARPWRATAPANGESLP